MVNLIVDLEVLGKGSNPLVTQVAFLLCDEYFIPQREFCINIDITSSLLSGFEVDAEVCNLWSGLPAKSQHATLYDQPRLPPHDAANAIDRWLADHIQPNMSVWLGSVLNTVPVFDNLMNRFGHPGLSQRFNSSKILDYGTIIATSWELNDPQTKHALRMARHEIEFHALSDCFRYAQILNSVRSIMRGEYEIIGISEDTTPPAESTTLEVVPNGGFESTTIPVVGETKEPEVDLSDLGEEAEELLARLGETPVDPNEPRWEDDPDVGNFI